MRLEFEKTWMSSRDFPTYEDSEQQVRADFQYHPDAIRDYLNQSLLAELEGENGAANIGSGEGSLKDALEKVDGKLAEVDQAIVDLSAGEPPEAVKAARVEFTAGEWSKEGEEVYTLEIPQEGHRRRNAGFGLRLWEKAEGEERTSWNTAGTWAVFRGDTGGILLTAPGAYDGGAVFFGV